MLKHVASVVIPLCIILAFRLLVDCTKMEFIDLYPKRTTVDETDLFLLLDFWLLVSRNIANKERCKIFNILKVCYKVARELN